MNKLSKKQWVGVVAGLVVVSLYFYSDWFFSFFGAPSSAPTSASAINSGDFSEPTSGPSNEPSSQPISEQINTQPKMEQKNQTPSVTIKDTVVGKGAVAVDGSKVSVNYTGTFLNGVKFDSSYDRGAPLPFQIGAGQLIPGFDRGVIGMKVGGKRTITIPPELAYGASGVPNVIPPNSTIIFEVELMEVK